MGESDKEEPQGEEHNDVSSEGEEVDEGAGLAAIMGEPIRDDGSDVDENYVPQEGEEVDYEIEGDEVEGDEEVPLEGEAGAEGQEEEDEAVIHAKRGRDEVEEGSAKRAKPESS